jgi:hypothetical protein
VLIGVMIARDGSELVAVCCAAFVGERETNWS